jgi:hypothetical protein
MPPSAASETRLTFLSKPDLNVIGKLNEIGTDCAGICAFYEQCSQENVWGVLNALPDLITGTRGYYFGKHADGPAHCDTHMVGVEVPPDVEGAPTGMTLRGVPASVYAVLVAVGGNGAPWAQAHKWLASQTAWAPNDAAPWSEDDGPKGCSLVFVPVSPVGASVLRETAICEYPLTNDLVATVSHCIAGA